MKKLPKLVLEEKETPAQMGVRVLVLIKWILIGILTGIAVGLAGTGFYYGVAWATAFRKSHDWIIALLPAAGLLIVFLYRAAGIKKDRGTNLVLDTISQGDYMPLRQAPLIAVATVLTHLCGGSSGREGAALQLGGSLGYNLGRLFHLDDNDKKIITMCGMSAGFSALFGTPMTASFMAMEITSVGVMYYASLVPCVLSALTASLIAKALGTEPEVFAVHVVPEFGVRTMAFAALLAVLCAVIAMLFCRLLHLSGKLYQRFFPNPYLRVFVGGCIVAALTYLTGTRIYNGAGMDVIQAAVMGRTGYADFLLKMLFTALTLGAGFKGGEIVPSLYIGATFGSAYANLLGLHPALCSAIGMAALFCGVTNCPISALLICFEMFGLTGMPYYLIAIAFAYTFSGYTGLYSSQHIVYSKFQDKYINHKAE